MKNFFLFLSLLLCANFSFAQAYINTDRPDQSEGTYVLPKGYLQLENGFLYEQNQQNYGLMLRYGLFSSTEIRWESTLEKPLAFTPVLSSHTLSFKQFVFKGTSVLPEITLVGYLSYDAPQRELFPNAALAFSHSLSSSISLDYNLALTGPSHDFFFTTQLSHTFANNVVVFGEYFATFGENIREHSFDAGVLLPLTPNLQIDFALGKSLSLSHDDYFFSLGLGYVLFKKNSQLIQ